VYKVEQVETGEIHPPKRFTYFMSEFSATWLHSGMRTYRKIVGRDVGSGEVYSIRFKPSTNSFLNLGGYPIDGGAGGMSTRMGTHPRIGARNLIPI